MAQSLVQFTLKCCMNLLATVMFGVTTVIIKQSIIAVVYFIVFATYCTIFQTSMTFFFRHSIFFWYLLIILTLTHLILLTDQNFFEYEVDCSDILLNPLTAQYRVQTNSTESQGTVTVLFLLAVLCICIELFPFNCRVRLPQFCVKYKHDFGRVLLITGLRLADLSCALSLALCAIHRVSPITIPVLLVALLLFTTLPASAKHTLCSICSHYVAAITVFKLIIDAYKGLIDYPDFCKSRNLLEWLYWVGLISDNSNPALAPVICLITLTARFSLLHIKEMYEQKYKETLTELQFPDVEYTNANKGTIFFIKFYTNYMLYKFGYEIYMTLFLLSATIAANVISLISLIAIIICLLIGRWRVRRIFLIFVVYHLGVLLYSLIAYIGLAPGRCYEMPVDPQKAPYLAFINNGQYTANAQLKSSYVIYCYFLNVAFSIIQHGNFMVEQLEGDMARGGSNDGILLVLHRNEPLQQNPVPDFFSAQSKIFLDELKQFVCAYYHWVVLLIVLADGTRFSSPVFLSSVLIILAFINLWRGSDLYLSHPSVFIRKWQLITIYLLAAIWLRIAALADDFLFDVVTFAALLLQLRLISTWHFQRAVIDLRADRIICFRGVVLQTQLIYKAMTYKQQRDRHRLITLVSTTEKMAKLNLPFGEWLVESVRGWNEILLRAADVAAGSADEETSSSRTFSRGIEIENYKTESRKEKQKQYITLTTFLYIFASWLGRKTLDYRYMRFVINKEKKLLLRKLPKEMSLASQSSLAVLEKCNLGRGICLVTNSSDIIKYMNEVHDRWLRLPLTHRLLNTIGAFLVCNTALLCYLLMIIVHGHGACLLTLPLAMLVFFWGAVTERKRRLLWTIATFYVQIMIVVSLYFKFTHIPWDCRGLDPTKCGKWSIQMIGRFVGIADEPTSVGMSLFLVLALFTHRHNMRRNGFWYATSRRLLQNEDDNKCCLLSILLDIFKLRQCTPYNYYPWMILSEVVALIILIVNFPDFDLARRAALTLSEERSTLLPDSFVYYFMTSIGMIVLDRIIYLRRAIRVKFVYLVLEVIVTHCYVLIILFMLPHNRPERVTIGLFLWYVARGIHMLVSAFQVRDGYPKFITGHVMMKANLFNWILYIGYFYAVPVFEIATVLDWTFTPTTLGLFDFYTLQTINYYLHFISGIRKFEVFYPRRRAELISLPVKVLLGGGTLIGIFIVLIILILFISENMFVGTLLPINMIFTLRVEYNPALFEFHLEDFRVIDKEDYDKLMKYFADDVYAQEFIKSMGTETIVVAGMPTRGMNQYVHPDWEEILINDLENVRALKKRLKLKSRIYLQRMRIHEHKANLLKRADTTPRVTAREWEMELDEYQMHGLENALKSNDCSSSFEIDVTDIVRPMITVPNRGLMYENPVVGKRHYNRQTDYFNYSYNLATLLIIKPDCTNVVKKAATSHIATLEQYSIDYDGRIANPPLGPAFIFLVYKVSSSYLRFLNISTPSLAMTFVMVFLLSFKLRDIVMTKPFELTFRELGDPGRLIRLCCNISAAREAKLYDLEHDLYGKLIYILRSSETLIRYTQFKMKRTV